MSERSWPSRLPLPLLLLSLSTVFFFGGDRGHFYRPGNHDIVSANTLGVVGNLSAEHGFLGYYYRTLKDDGAPTFLPYNRFPPGGYWLLKLATLPFAEGLAGALGAARGAMLFAFLATAVLAYLCLARIVENRWIAVGATALAFSGYYSLYYNDMVATEGGLALLGVLLAFHGMVVFAYEGRFAQLLAKVAVALLLGWHVYALLFAFAAIGLGHSIWERRRASRQTSGDGADQARALAPGPYLILGFAALAFGTALLAFNFLQEYWGLNGETAFWELRSFRSMLGRLGIETTYLLEEELSWPHFLGQQAMRIAVMSTPYALYSHHAQTLGEFATAPLAALVAFWGIAGAAAVLLGARSTRGQSRMLLAVLLLHGPLWALGMRYAAAYHDFEGMQHVGVPLVLYSLLLLQARKRWGDGVVAGLAVLALLLFALASYRMSGVGNDAVATGRQQALLADFDAIRSRVPPGAAVAIPVGRRAHADRAFAGASRASIYYLAGRTIVFCEGPQRLADYFVLPQRMAGAESLTPDNRLRFLYRRSSASVARMADYCPLLAGRGSG